MRRSAMVALILCIAVPAMMFTGCTAMGTEAEPEKVELSRDLWVERISDSIWRHVSYREVESYGRVPANGLVVADDGEAAILDTPWDDAQTALLIDWIGKRLKASVVVVVPTHYHDDCMGGLAETHRRGAESYALDRTAALAKEAGYELPRNTFTGRIEVEVGSLKLVLSHHGGAHTPDNIVVYIPAERTLFGGCAVRSAYSRRLGNVREAVLEEWPATIESIQDTYGAAEVIVPGHGSPGGTELFQRTLELVREHEE